MCFCPFRAYCLRVLPPWRHPNHLCKSVKSVGVTLQLRRQGYLRYYLSYSNHLCKSVQSVGGHPQQKLLWILCNLWESLCSCGGKDTSATIFRTQTICANLWNLWEVIPSRRFCEYCEICGRSSQASRSNPWGPLRSHRFSPHYKHCVLFRAAHGAWADRKQTGAGMEQTGAGGEYRALLHWKRCNRDKKC